MPLSMTFIRVRFFNRSKVAHVASGGLKRPSKPVDTSDGRSADLGHTSRPPVGRVTFACSCACPAGAKRVIVGRVAPGQQIDGPDQHRAARIFDALHHLLGVVPLERHVELLPRRRAEGLANLLDRIGRDVRQDHLVAACLRGARRGQLAFGVKRALSADGADEERRFPLDAEHFGAEIGLRHVDEAARLQADALERLDVGLQRERRRRRRSPCSPSARAASARRAASSKSITCSASFALLSTDGSGEARELLRPRANGRREHGAGGEELEEFAAIAVHAQPFSPRPGGPACRRSRKQQGTAAASRAGYRRSCRGTGSSPAGAPSPRHRRVRPHSTCRGP